jgi:hypothetical protein
MQAALSSVISSEGAVRGVSSSVELSAEEDEEPLVILEKKLERTGVTGTLFEGATFEGVFFDDGVALAVSALEILGLDGVSFSFSFSFSFDDELFFVFGDLGGSVLDRESFGGALSGNAPIGVAVFEDEDFAGGGFDAVGFGAGGAAAFGGADFGVGAAAFGDGGFAAAAFGGAPLGMVTFGGTTFGGGG